MANAEVSIINEQHQFAINMSIPFNGLSPKIFNDLCFSLLLIFF